MDFIVLDEVYSRNTAQKTKYRTTWTQIKTGVDLMYSESVIRHALETPSAGTLIDKIRKLESLKVNIGM
jgi:hypothetical protein